MRLEPQREKINRINPYNLNNSLVEVGYKSTLDIHGLRRTAGTAFVRKRPGLGSNQQSARTLKTRR